VPTSVFNIPLFLTVLSSMIVFCFCSLRLCKKILDRTRYDYFRDLTLVGVWFVVASFFGNSILRTIVGCSILSLSVGMVQHVYPRKNLRWLFFFVGLLFSLLGPRISFFGLPGGKYIYLSPIASIIVTACWITMFPILLQELDSIPGIVGHLLAVTFLLILVVALISGQDLGNAFIMSFCGLALLALFWSRHGHLYRQLGKPLSSFWGVLVAGTSVLGVSKGITLSTLIIIPIGLFAIPIMETSLHFASLALTERPKSVMVIYRELVKHGMDHPSAVHFITLICATIGSIVTVFQLIDDGGALLASALISGCALALAFPMLNTITWRSHICRRPYLWNVPIDNVSMNYAVSKFMASAKRGTSGFIAITVNALAAYMAKTNDKYSIVANRADLSLPDGHGILWALKYLGTPVQERVTGIDFMEQVCRSAASEKIPVYLLGSTEDHIREAARNLEGKYPGLEIVGCRNGYFDEAESTSVVKDIKESEARILFVGLGVPKQEIWIYDHIADIGHVCAVGVGGAFDVISGQLRRAPEYYQKFGMEWLYRLFQEPWRFKRDLGLICFIGNVLLTKIVMFFRRNEE